MTHFLILCMLLLAIGAASGKPYACKSNTKFSSFPSKSIYNATRATLTVCKSACDGLPSCNVLQYSAGSKVCILASTASGTKGQRGTTVCTVKPPSPPPRPRSYPPPSTSDGFTCVEGKGVARILPMNNDELTGYLQYRTPNKNTPPFATMVKNCKAWCEQYTSPCLAYIVDESKNGNGMVGWGCYSFNEPVKFTGTNGKNKKLCTRMKCDKFAGRKLKKPANYDELRGYLQHQYSGNENYDLLEDCRRTCVNRAGTCMSYLLDSTRSCYLFDFPLEFTPGMPYVNGGIGTIVKACTPVGLKLAS